MVILFVKLQSQLLSKVLPLTCFCLNGKKAILSLVTKKATKKKRKNYWPVSLLLIWGKILKDTFNETSSFFLANNLLVPNQSGFKPNDSCSNQLLSISHEIYSSFGDGFEVRHIFLDISKGFNKLWHKGIIFNLT